MYNPELKSYLGKPFTLLGQPSVTSIVSTFLYITIRELKVKKNKWLFIIYLLSILSFQTGTGYISLLIVCFYLTWKYKVYYLLGLPLVGIIMYYIVINNVVVKLSHTYFVFLIELFEKFIIDYLEAVSRNYDLLMGCDPSYDLPIDLGPLFYIGKLGLITFVIYSLLLLVIMFTQRNLSLRFIILILLFGNLHYPVMFYPIMNIFLMFTLYIVITFGFNNFVLCQRKENSQ
ncbi:MAG: hypothetical protein N4A49_15310 [Marinifilaceae bacterium]|nr:hypothetical protein [Marinifilaceae bacterium]